MSPVRRAATLLAMCVVLGVGLPAPAHATAGPTLDTPLCMSRSTVGYLDTPSVLVNGLDLGGEDTLDVTVLVQSVVDPTEKDSDVYSAGSAVATGPSVGVSLSPDKIVPVDTESVWVTLTSDGVSVLTSALVPVCVLDTAAPVLTLPANQTAEATGPSGAAVTFTAPTATDVVDGAVTPSCSKASGATFPLGKTTVTCSATDAAKNTASGSFDVTVLDTTPPQVTFSDCPSSVRPGQAVTLNWTATDAVGLPTGSDSGAFLFSGLQAGSTFRYTVAVFDNAGVLGFGVCSFPVTTQPTAPGAPTGPAFNKDGFNLQWTASTVDQGLTANYSIERRKVGATTDWEQIGTGLTGLSTDLPSQPGGHWLYRVIASDSYSSSDPSSPSSEIVSDHGAPRTPTLAIAAGQRPALVTASGLAWYRDSVGMTLADKGDPPLLDGTAGSGVDPASYAHAFSETVDGNHVVSRTVSDRAGNASNAATRRVAVDSKPPTLSLPCPETVSRFSLARLTFSAADASSGLVGPAQGFLSLNTLVPGRFTRQITVSDRVGHATTKSCTYTVK